MPSINENTTLLRNGHHLTSNGYSNEQHQHYNQQQPQLQKEDSHCIDVLETSILNGYTSILDEDRLSADLSFDELLPFLDDPWWQKVRRTLFGTFLLVFWFILFTACMLAYMQHGELCDIPTARARSPVTANTTVRGVLQKM